MIAALAALAIAASGPSFVINGDRNAGGIRFGTTPAQAKALLGTPDSQRASQANSLCTLTWRRFGVQIQFISFQSQACTKGDVLVFTATDKRWHTKSGLYVGAPESAVRAHQSKAKLHAHGGLHDWWLITHGGCNLSGPNAPAYGSLVARVRNGRVSALIMQAVACE